MIEAGAILFGLLLLVMNVYAVIRVAPSPSEPIEKILWIIIILIIPLFGLILWMLVRPEE